MFLDNGEDRASVGYPGLTRSEILAKYPEYQLASEITEAGWWNRDREDPPTASGRAIRVAENLVAMSDTEDRVAIISHGAFINILFKALLDQLPGNHIYYRHNNTGISRITLN
jgi:broad specificity phosphatase PhoE